MQKPFKAILIILSGFALYGCGSGVAIIKPIDMAAKPKIGVALFANCPYTSCYDIGYRVAKGYSEAFETELITNATGKETTLIASITDASAMKPTTALTKSTETPLENLRSLKKSHGYDYLVEGDITYYIPGPIGGRQLWIDLKVRDTNEGDVVATQKKSLGASAFTSVDSMIKSLAQDLKDALEGR